MATGGRSERFAMQLFPDLPELAFVELSVFTGDALKSCIDMGVQSAVFVGMIGKMIKTAQGHMQTHVAGNQVDFAFLAEVCRSVHAPVELVAAVENANTGRHFLELCQQHHFLAPLARIVELALDECDSFVRRNGGAMELETILVDFDGGVLGRAKRTPVDLPVGGGTLPPLIERLAADPSHAYDDDEPLDDEGAG
jgi:cobalt-precorrin-5B (C1)-methyltransferase